VAENPSRLILVRRLVGSRIRGVQMDQIGPDLRRAGLQLSNSPASSARLQVRAATASSVVGALLLRVTLDESAF
jgi:hypothetical protein